MATRAPIHVQEEGPRIPVTSSEWVAAAGVLFSCLCCCGAGPVFTVHLLDSVAKSSAE